ncbi:MAG: aminotransferase class I/II-fold pyridoxal phosphate-dependent enzyme [Alphaproteobacteria bacterium]|nr:aminotransferase class I/II-fold pyridoxal phosphate-dependent enzyme [Alphaproteobacteria bacterium]
MTPQNAAQSRANQEDNMLHQNDLKHIAHSQTLLMNEQSRIMESEGRDIYKLGFGQSPFQPPEHVTSALRNAAQTHGYTPVAGLPELREAIAAFHSEMDERNVSADQVLVGPGSKTLIFNTLLAFNDAAVLIPAPAWVSYAPQAKLTGHGIVPIPARFEDRWHITPDTLDKACAQLPPSQNKILILNTPGNPDGLAYTREELTALAHIFEKHGIWVIADELYAPIHHTGQHVCLADIYPDRALVTSGMSKWAAAGGWRLGLQILPDNVPQNLKNTLLGIASETFSCAAAPVQQAAIKAYVWNDTLRHYLACQRMILGTVGRAASAALNKAGLRVHDPEGGFYLIADFSPLAESLRGKDIVSDMTLCSRLLHETGVALLPGTAFGLPATALTARLAYVDFDGTALMQALNGLDLNSAAAGTTVRRHTERMTKGLNLLCDWVKS